MSRRRTGRRSPRRGQVPTCAAGRRPLCAFVNSVLRLVPMVWRFFFFDRSVFGMRQAMLPRNRKEDAPRGEFWPPCAATLDGTLYVVITNVADALITPTAAGLAVALHNAAHPQVGRRANDGHRVRAFGRESKYVGCARFLCRKRSRGGRESRV